MQHIIDEYIGSGCDNRIQRYPSIVESVPLCSIVKLSVKKKKPPTVKRTPIQQKRTSIVKSTSSEKFEKIVVETAEDKSRLEMKKKLAIYLIDGASKSEYYWYSNKKEYRIIFRIDNVVPCVLHFEMRVGEWILTRLCQFSQNSGTIQEKAERLKKIADLINQVLSGQFLCPEQHEEDEEEIIQDKEEDEEEIIIPLDGIEIKKELVDSDDCDFILDEDEDPITFYKLKSTKNQVEHIKISCVRLKLILIEAVMKKFLKIALPFCEEKILEQISALLESFYKIRFWIHKVEDFTDLEINEFQEDADQLFRLWIAIFGPATITNYIDMLGSGVFSKVLRKYRNLYRYANHAMEGFVGNTRGFIQKRTKSFGGKGTKLQAQKSTTQSIAYRAVRQINNLKLKLGENDDQLVLIQKV